MEVFVLGCLSAAVAIFTVTCICAINLISKKHNQTAAYKVVCLGTIISAVIYYFPFYCDYFDSNSVAAMMKSFFLAVHHAIRLFVVDVNYEELRVFSSEFGLLGNIYAAFGIGLFLVAPILTFTFIVSFLQTASILLSIWFSPKRDFYIFSQVNLQAFYLAQDIREKYPRVNIAFLGIDKEKKTEYERIRTVTRPLSPLLLPIDCTEMNRLMNRYRRNAKFFIIDEDEEVNEATVIGMLDATPHASQREIYVRLRQSNHLLDNLPAYEKTQVFRIEHVRSLATYNLEQLGERLFVNAKPDANGTKVISLLVVGLGRTGSELVKNLAWFTQIEGYTTKIHVFEQDRTAIERFKHRCPGFFGYDAKDFHCEIVIHPDMVLETPAFDRELQSIGDVSFVFVALGSDQMNVNAALDIRLSLTRVKQHPPIQAILRNEEVGNLIANSKNVRGISYDIEFIGSFRDIYSLDFIIDAQNKEEVLRNISAWGGEEHINEFLSHEDQVRMAKARVIHTKLMDAMGIAGQDRVISEHRRWVNMLLSEGYLYSQKRDDLAKFHPMLVPFDLLPEKYKNTI